MRKTAAEKKLDAEITAIYSRIGNGVVIPIMAIPVIMRAARTAHAAGADMEAAMAAVLAKVRVES